MTKKYVGNNENIDDKTIITLAFIKMAEDITDSMVDNKLLKYGGILKTAERLEKQGLLKSGNRYNGKVLENKSYMTTAQGLKILNDYIKIHKGISLADIAEEVAYHPV